MLPFWRKIVQLAEIFFFTLEGYSQVVQTPRYLETSPEMAGSWIFIRFLSHLLLHISPKASVVFATSFSYYCSYQYSVQWDDLWDVKMIKISAEIDSMKIKIVLQKIGKVAYCLCQVKMSCFWWTLKTNKEKAICQINSLYKVLGIVLILASKYIASETAAAIGVPTYLNLYCFIVILQDSFTYSIDQICNLSGRNDKYVHRVDFILVHKSFIYHSF